MGEWRASELCRAPALPLLIAITIGCGESEPAKTTATESGGSSNSGSSGAGGGAIGGASNGGSSLAESGGTSGGALATGGSAGDSGSASGAGGSASGAGGSASGAGSSASGAGGSAGESGDCPNDRVDAEPGIVAIIAGETIEFRRELLWYDGRPPLLDLSALTDETGWSSFRLVIDPDGDSVVPGLYQSGPGNVTYVQARSESGEYDSVDNDASTICVNEAGVGAGARVSGTFLATVANYDGSRSFTASGTFSGTLGAE